MDSCFFFVQDFINGTISYRRLNNAMHLGKLGQKFMPKSQLAFDQIRFVGREVAENSEWYAKKMLWDKNRPTGVYFSVKPNKRQRGDLYIVQIMDGEMNADDLRLQCISYYSKDIDTNENVIVLIEQTQSLFLFILLYINCTPASHN